MNYRQDTTKVCLEYVEVHAQSIRLPVRTVVENPVVYRLMLSLSQPKSVLKNGRRLCFEGQVLSLLSDKDPSELQRAIEASCQNDRGSARTDAIFRRSSSIILELDMCEEVARKSSGFSPNNIQGQEGPCTDPASIQRSGQMLDKGAEEIEEGNTTNGTLNVAHSRRNSYRQDCQQAHHAGESPVPISNPSMPRKVLRKPNGTFAPNPDTGGRRTSRLRSTNRGRVRRSNTQESMVIYARHSKQKVYTTNSKAAVDWDEDLRPSADEVKRPLQDAEITSISSPLPGETSFVGSRLAVPGKKGAAKGKTQTTKRKNISARPAKSTGNNVKEVTTVPAVAEDADKSEDKVRNKLSGDGTTGKLVLCSSKSGPRDVGKERIGTCAINKCAHVELDSDNAIFGCESAVRHHDGDRNRSLEGQAPGKKERSLDYQHQLSASEVGEDNSQKNTPRCRPTARELQGRGRAVGNKLSAAFQQDDPLPGHSGHEENSLEHIQRQNKLTNEDKLGLSDTLYVSVGESGVQEQLELTESGVERYTTYEGNSPFETPNMNFTSKFDDDLYTGCSLQRHTNRGNTFKIDDEEQKRVFQSEIPAASSPLRGGESHFDEEFDSEMCNETLGAAEDTCSSDMHEGTSVDIESPRARPEKRKIAALNPDYMQDGPTTGNHAAKTGFKKETRRFGRRDHMYPTKRLKGTPKSTIVDSDGSPRLLFHVMNGCMVHRTDMEDWTPTSEHVRGIMKDGKIETHSDDLPALCERNVIPGSEHSATCTNKVKDVLTFQDRLMACAGKPTSSNTPLRNAAQSIPDARLTLRRDTKPHATCNSLPRVTVVSDQSSAQPNSHKSVVTADDVLENTSWQTSLQVLHKRAQGMLHATSEHIIQEIESEKKTINEVLEVYRRDCHRVLDQLFEAQDERIRLCQQQMNSIREHHTGVCQELMQRLERDEQRLQDRMQLRKMN
ncbi:hypothetical protein AbraIFM66950_006237 [Aspergillus brasiliensis]|nr:hypothetical protein AbraIFM66950_006237 [Aspergillus brasiliensis]